MLPERAPATAGRVTPMTMTMTMTRTVRARIGCSGWLYKDWRGTFYPAALPQRSWLAYYATQFDTVELNGTFYRLPEAAKFSAWRKTVPADFLFAVKASRFLTHMKRLTSPAEPLDRLFDRARHLRATLGPVLYQLPTGWKQNIERLDGFLRALPKRRSHVIEFRDPELVYGIRLRAPRAARGRAVPSRHGRLGHRAADGRAGRLRSLSRSSEIRGCVFRSDARRLGRLARSPAVRWPAGFRVLQQYDRRASHEGCRQVENRSRSPLTASIE